MESGLVFILASALQPLSSLILLLEQESLHSGHNHLVASVRIAMSAAWVHFLLVKRPILRVPIWILSLSKTCKLQTKSNSVKYFLACGLWIHLGLRAGERYCVGAVKWIGRHQAVCLTLDAACAKWFWTVSKSTAPRQKSSHLLPMMKMMMTMMMMTTKANAKGNKIMKFWISLKTLMNSNQL